MLFDDLLAKATLLIYLAGIGIVKIDEVSAKRLPNKTLPILGDDGYYIVEIDVFHQLHSLA